MSLAFLVYGLPRSGTTWVSNWLTTNDSLCWHDPVEWASLDSAVAWAESQSVPAGICCTGSWAHHQKWQVPTLFLTRPREEIQISLEKIGLPRLPEDVVDAFEALDVPDSRRVSLVDLMSETTAADVHHFLLPRVPFNRARYQELARMNVQPSESEVSRIRGYLSCPHYGPA